MSTGFFYHDFEYGVRIHSWVLVRSGRREVAKSFFIEPFSGKSFDQSADEFLGIETIHNQHNYYVCMQDCSEGCVNLHWDVNDCIYWEALLPHKNEELVTNNQLDDHDEDDEEDEIIEKSSAIMMPESWVSEVIITDRMFETRCPYGKRTFLFKRTKIEKFAEYLREDGLTKKLTYYADLDYHTNLDSSPSLETGEWFQNRADCLEFRHTDKSSNIVTESFRKGRDDKALCRHQYNSKLTPPTAPRTFYYYHNARADGLFKRLIESKSITEFYINREDKLIQRCINYVNEYDKQVRVFGSSDAPNERQIESIKDIYSTRNGGRYSDVSDEISEIFYHIYEEKIHVKYHRTSDKISPITREFQKAVLGGGKGSDTNLAGTSGSVPQWDESMCFCYSNTISTDNNWAGKTESKDEIEQDKVNHRELFEQMKNLITG